MKKFIASLLVLVQLFSFIPFSAFAEMSKDEIIASIVGTEPACDCGTEQAELWYHSADCAAVKHYQTIASERSAMEIYALTYYGFSESRPDASDVINLWLYDNDQAKYTEVNNLVFGREKPVLPKKDFQQTLTKNGVTLEGILPDGADISVSELAEGGLDITIANSEGNPWQPAAGAGVYVTLPVNIEHDGYVDVLHVVDNAAKIAEIFENDNVFTLSTENVDDEYIASFADAIAAYQAATGNTDSQIVIEGFEHVPVENGTVTVYSLGGFSAWYVAANGTITALNSSELDFSTVAGRPQPIYVRPGASLVFESSRSATYAIGGSGAAYASGQKISSWGYRYQLSVDIDAPVGATFTVKTGGKTINFEVSHLQGSDNTPVMIALLTTYGAAIPAEPKNTTGVSFAQYNSSGKLVGSAVTYVNSTTGFLDVNAIMSSAELQSNGEDGEDRIYGIVDYSGANHTLAYIPGLTQDIIDDIVAEYINDYAGERNGPPAGADPDDYKLVVYVVKYGWWNSQWEWHIDTKVVPRNDVILSYVYNAPEGFSAYDDQGTKDIPDPQTAELNTNGEATITVTNPSSNFKLEKTVGNETDTATFIGWNTDPNATKTTTTGWYGSKAPAGASKSSTITITEDTTLYAIWEVSVDYLAADLQLQKRVYEPNGTLSTTDTTSFTFTVSDGIANSGYEYGIYNASGVKQSSGNFSASAKTFTLKNGEYIRIEVVPNGTYTITETAVAGYTAANNGAGSTQNSGTVTYTYDTDSNTSGEFLYTISNTKVQTYTVTYTDGVDGAAFEDQKFTVEEGAATPSFVGTPEREGYTFKGWSPARAATVTEDKVYTAKWEIKTYTVTWKNWDGTVLDTDVNVPYGTMPEYDGTQPSKSVNGYDVTFSGWTPAIVTVTKDATYTATFTEVERTTSIYYEAATGGSVSRASDANIGVVNGPVNGSTASANPGYTFDGWYKGDELITTGYTITPSKGASGLYEGATYTAKFTENTVTVNYVAASGGSVTTKTETIGVATGAFSGSEAIPAEGYVFDGWYKGDTKVSTNPAFKPTEKVAATYTARFTEQDVTISYVAREGGTVTRSSETVGAVTGDPKGSEAVPGEGYEFLRWVDKDGNVVGTTPIFDPKDNTPATYYAEFRLKTYTIIWKNEDGTVLETDNGVKHGTMPEYNDDEPECSVPGYTVTFDGWTPAVVKATGNAEYVAKFKKIENKVTITYVAEGGGTVSSAGETVGVVTGPVNGSVATANANYEFAGWYDEGDNFITGEAEFVPAKSGNFYVSATYTAKFVEKQVTIKYVAEVGGSVSTKSETVGLATGTIGGSKATANTGYEFSGWYNGDTKVSDEPQFKPTEKVAATYTARFTQTLFTVTWKNHDGSVIKTDENVPYGATPAYSGDMPQKEPDAEFTYTFAGWDPAIVPVTEDAVYTAKFNNQTNDYTVTWVNWDDSLLEKDDPVLFGTMPEYNSDTPEREPDAQYSYRFIGWTPEVTEVVSDVVYKAVYEKTTNTYTVTWLDADGTELEMDEDVPYGEMPVFNQNDPEKDADAQYTYTFKGWSPEVSEVTGNATYTAVYDKAVNKYTVTWKNWDDQVLERDPGVEYGATPNYDGATPEREGDAQYTYTFKEWTPEVSEVTGNITYTAVFDRVTNRYTVTYTDGVGETEIFADQSYTEDYGTATPGFVGTPEREGYTFTGWNPGVADTVTGNITYKATWQQNTYTVIWKDWDDTVLETDNGVVHGAMAEFNKANPEREDTAQYDYEFTGWTPVPGIVTGNMEFTAVYERTVKQYTVTWKNWDGTEELDSETYDYGATPDYKGETPQKASDDQYTYTFKGWSPEISDVTGDAEYTAVFDKSPRIYTVTYIDGAYGTVFEDKELAAAYGAATPSFGADPEREGYNFMGWTPSVEPTVKGNATYTALWQMKTYTVVWKNGSTVLETDENVTHGTMPEYNGEAPVSSKPGYTVTWDVADGWTPVVNKVTGDAVYVAKFTETENTTSIYYEAATGGSVTNAADENIGVVNGPVTGSTAVPAAGYSFDGWYNEAGVKVSPERIFTPGKTGDFYVSAIYTAKFTENTVTVNYVAKNGGTVEPGSETIKVVTENFEGAVATPNAGYDFLHWEDANGNVVSEEAEFVPTQKVAATYYAVFEQHLYTVIWKNHDGTVLDTETYTYGATPAYSGEEVPEKEGDSQYSWQHTGWTPSIVPVTSDAEYTAVFTPTTKAYTVYWVNYDNTELEKDENIDYGTTPKYDGETPVRESDAQYSYSFTGWSPSVSAVTGDVTYKAQFQPTLREYTVTWVDDDDTELEKDENVPYGEMPVFDGTNPEKADTAQYDYEFDGWTPQLSAVTGNITYKATYTETLKEYTVTWLDEDGTELEKDVEVPYGTTPSYDSPEPKKDADKQYTYTFDGWTPNVSMVTGDATYTAVYDEVINQYTVTYVDGEADEVIFEDKSFTRDYGTATPAFGGIPEREGYNFLGWSPKVADTVTDNATYTAVWEQKTYTVTWKDWNGNVLETDREVVHGTMPEYDGETPEKQSSAKYSYEFIGWDADFTPVDEDRVYTAVYKENIRKYTVTWLDEDGTVLEKDENVPYGTTPSFDESEPQKASDGQYTYEFDGWTPDVSDVTGDATYTATYAPTEIEVTVSYEADEGGSVAPAEETVGIVTGTFEGSVATPDTGYEFIGWHNEAGEPVGEDAQFVPAEKVEATYTAKFRKLTFTVTWVDENGTTVLHKDEEVPYGEMPFFDGETPEKQDTDQYDYEFKGWTPAFSEVTGNVTYKATYTETLKKYTVTWKNWDGSVLRTDEDVPYGTMPGYGIENPVRPDNEKYSYQFIGWTPVVDKVTGNAEYTAEYRPVIHKYVVTWNNYDNNQLEQDIGVPYGTIPTYDGETPEREGNAQYTYTFVGWNADIVEVTEDVTYTAVFDEKVNTYTVIWKNHDGAVLETDEGVEYGKMPVYDGLTPTKEKDGYTVTFDGWTPEVSEVTGNAEYIAVFTEEQLTCTITYKADNGGSVTAKSESVLVDTGVPAGSKAVPNAGWRFIGWYDEAGVKVGEEETFVPEKGDNGIYEEAEYTAKFERMLLNLTIETKCDMANAANGEQGFLFIVTGTPDDTTVGALTITVSLVGNDEVTIAGLPVGDYKVTPDNRWPWRFEDQRARDVELRLESKTETFAYATPDSRWLSGHGDNSWKNQ